MSGLEIRQTEKRLARAVRSLERLAELREAMGLQMDLLARQIEAERVHLAVLTGERRIGGIRPVKMTID